jgi:hypothetical protein
MKLPEAIELDLALPQPLNNQSRLRLWNWLLRVQRQGNKANKCHCVYAEHAARIALCFTAAGLKFVQPSRYRDQYPYAKSRHKGDNIAEVNADLSPAAKCGENRFHSELAFAAPEFRRMLDPIPNG